jgi:3-isopropylmalate dehydrogenase
VAAGRLGSSTTDYDLGAASAGTRTGETLPDSSVVEEFKGHDAILLGAIGDPTVPSGVLERGVLLPLRFALDHYVNLRPAKLYPGVASPLAVERVAPNGIDFVVVREGTEGPYVGNGGAVRVGTPHEIATEVSVNTRFGVERVVRDAFARAQARPRKHLTLVHKHNVLVNAGHLWRRTVERSAGVPRRRDRLPARRRGDDLHGDRPGPLRRHRHRQPLRRHHHRHRRRHRRRHRPGGAATSTPAVETRRMFEPVHGSAPDIAGQGKADPTARSSRSRCCSTTSVATRQSGPHRRRRRRRPRRAGECGALDERRSATRSPAFDAGRGRCVPGR